MTAAGVARAALGFFLSLRTAIWLILAMIALFLFGAVLMPAMGEYQSINSVALMEWLVASPARATWWLWGAMGLLALLTANTVLCSVESVVKKAGLRQWLLVISPQVIHLGFALIVLAHLLSSVGAFKGTAVVRQGSRVILPDGAVMRVGEISVETDPRGFPLDYGARVAFLSDGATAEGRLAPNRPAFHGGFGVYLKDVRPGAALIEVSREPGAPWALAGGALFAVGTAALFFLKIRRER
ncbi:MAG: cytochrome c biogenesis protein ResB [Thermodesulfovibrionales bacterium]